MKKIIFITPYIVAGGSERVMTSLANEISNMGYEVVFVTFDTASSFYPLSSKVKRIGMGLVTDGMSKSKKLIRLISLEIKRYKMLKKILINENPDVVVSFLFMSNIISTLCCRQVGIPIILSERNDPARYSKMKSVIMKLVYAQANGFVSQSRFMQEYAEVEYKVKHIKTIPNPLADNQYTSQPYSKKKKIILSVGRLIEQKNHEMTINAFAEVAEKFPEYSLVIYGEGPLRGKLEELITKKKLNNRVKLPGIKNEVIKENADCQLFIMSSSHEGYPNALVEALANGILSISTDFGTRSARDLIHNEENGFLIPVNDKDALVTLLNKILSAPESFNSIAASGRYIVNETNLSAIATQWIHFADNVINESEIKS